MNSCGPHLVRLGRGGYLESPTLPGEGLRALEDASRRVAWWRDRWTYGQFRAAALDVSGAHGGLLLLSTSCKFDIPAAFADFFEPIELSAGWGNGREELRTLSGEKPTRQERHARWVFVVVACAMSVPFVMTGIGAFMGMPRNAIFLMFAVFGCIALMLLLVRGLQNFGGRWFLVPGGVAIVRRPRRRGTPPRVTILTRANAVPALRYVSTGKTTVLVLELWVAGVRGLRRPVSEREAMSLIAAWCSPHPPPRDSQLEELLAW